MERKQQYEFTSSQNDTIRTLSKSLQFIGTVTAIFAIVFAAGGVWAVIRVDWAEAVTQGMLTVFLFSMGVLMLKAGSEFRAIVLTTGNDVEHLMEALDNLRQIYSILSVIVILCILLAMAILPFR